MSGIHIHAHDVEDEGIEIIKKRLHSMGDIEYIFAQVNSIFERNPVPIGILPHNPIHNVVMGDGKLMVHVDFKETNINQKFSENVTSEFDYFKTLKSHISEDEFKIIPWVNVLNGDFSGDFEKNQVINYKGEKVEHWLCPNGPDVIQFWNKVLASIKDKYNYDTFLIDRIRYPDWAGSKIDPSQLFTCFCDNCVAKMHRKNIDIVQLKERISFYVNSLNNKNYRVFATEFTEDEIIKQWTEFKKESISELVKKLTIQNPTLNLWLDLWSPKYSWLLGQDYSELTKYSNTLKHFPYHKLGGGADVQGLIEYYAHNEEEQEDMFTAFLSVFNMPYKITYKEFKKEGYPIQFVKDMNENVRSQSQSGTYIFSGIQMWNLQPDELIKAVEAAKDSSANSLIYYCYGWAGLDLISKVSNFNAQQGKCYE